MQFSEIVQIAAAFAVLILVFAFTRKFHAWRIGRICLSVIEDLKARNALDPASAAALPYAKRSLLRFGLRDYRPKALEYLALSQVVGITPDGRYYLKHKDGPDSA